MPHGHGEHDEVTKALELWRSAGAPAERLSGPTRDRILRESLRAQVAEPVLGRLFLPARQWLVGATVPVALAMVLGLGFWFRAAGPTTGPLGPSVASVEVQRQGDEVVFIIDNGGTPHRVTRSTDPRGLDAEPVPGRGQVFRDRIDAGSSIMYYRID